MIKVGFIGTGDVHGQVEEVMCHPPKGVKYTWNNVSANKVIDLPEVPLIKNIDIIESPFQAVLTENKWIYNGANFTQMNMFNFLGKYYDRNFRLKILEKILEKKNCKKLVFPSNAGKETMFSYGKIKNKEIINKSCVVQRAFRKIDNSSIKFNDSEKIRLLFVGSQFVLKGGKQLLDAFDILNKKYDVELNIVTNFATNPKFSDKEYTEQLKKRIKKMKNVNFGPVKRKDMVSKVYPSSDIFVVPTLTETYGYANIEAMAFGLPVISTNWPEAMPEIIDNNKSGYLIDIMKSDFMKFVYNNKDKYRSSGFYLPPKTFDKFLVGELINKLSGLIESKSLRKKMGSRGLNLARTKFSFEKRNKMMKKIYEDCLK